MPLRQKRRPADLWVDLPGQCSQKRDEVRLLPPAQAEGLDILRQPGVLDAASVVDRDDVLKRLLATIVHVRAALGNVPERRRLEGTLVRLALRHAIPADDGLR